MMLFILTYFISYTQSIIKEVVRVKSDSYYKSMEKQIYDRDGRIIQFIKSSDLETEFDTLIRKYTLDGKLIYEQLKSHRWTLYPIHEKDSWPRRESTSFERIIKYTTNNLIKEEEIKKWKGAKREKGKKTKIKYLYDNQNRLTSEQEIEEDKIKYTSFWKYDGSKLIEKMVLNSRNDTISLIRYNYDDKNILLLEEGFNNGNISYIEEYRYWGNGYEKKLYKYEEEEKKLFKKLIYKNDEIIMKSEFFFNLNSKWQTFYDSKGRKLTKLVDGKLSTRFRYNKEGKIINELEVKENEVCSFKTWEYIEDTLLTFHGVINFGDELIYDEIIENANKRIHVLYFDDKKYSSKNKCSLDYFTEYDYDENLNIQKEITIFDCNNNENERIDETIKYMYRYY